MLLHERYNKAGKRVLVERKELELLEAAGYDLKEMPEGIVIEEKVVVEPVVKEVVEPEIVIKEENTSTKRGRKPKQVDAEKDIIL